MFDIHALRSRGRRDPYKAAYIGGTFDCLHRGHLALFDRARRIARAVIVGVNTDDFAAAYKRQPLMPLADRMAVLNTCRLVDWVIVNEGGADSRPAIERSQADCIVHGSDWQGDSLREQLGLTQHWLDEHGIALVILPYTPWTSTTQLLTEYAQRARVAH